MKQLDFDEWFDNQYPVESMGQEIIRLSFKEVAKKAWDASRENMSTQDI